MRKATGSVEPYKRADGTTYYRARIRLADGTRERVDIPDKYTTDERRALYAAAIQEREDERGELLAKKRERIATKQRAADPRAPETLAKYRERLNVHRDELGKGKGDPSAWNAWIVPHLGGLPMATLAREDVERFRDVLDDQIATHTRTEGAEGISPKRALNVWSEVTTTLKAAVNAKRRELRVRTDNPCAGVLPPERGDARRKTFIYPAELLAVLGCEQTPIEWREVYAIGSYLYLRPGELRALTVGDVDLEAMVVHVTKAFDERSGDTKTPKTENGVRDVPIPGTLAPLLRRMCKDREPGELVVPILETLTENRRAVNLRLDLQRAGVNRPRLYENTATTMGVNFRSLRDSGITWLALTGLDVVKMQRRAGHDSIETTLSYVKQAEDLSGAIGEPFGPLPVALVEGVKGGDGGGSRQRLSARHRAKHRAKYTATTGRDAESKAFLEVRAGLVPQEPAQNKGFREESRSEAPPRDDLSTRPPVDAGPSEKPLARSLRDELADLIARAVREGDLTLAQSLLGAQTKAAAVTPPQVVDLGAERAKRRR